MWGLIPLPWKLAGAAGIAALVLGGLGWAFLEGKSSGTAGVLKTTIEVQQRIDDADANGPRTPDAVDKRLRDGTF